MASYLPAAAPLQVLIVDDEKNIRSTLALCLESAGCKVIQAENGRAALEALDRAPVDLAFLDLRLGNENGAELLPRLLEKSPSLDVVIVTAYGTVDAAVEAMKKGARDFLAKPFSPAQIRHIVERVSGRTRLEKQVVELRDRLAETAPEVDLTTRSPVFRRLLEQVQKVALHDVSVLLLGESGTGKGVLAQKIHQLSPRRDRPFVVVNCPTLSEELLASELFGHARGAFTGAVKDQPGRVEMAHRGTLFLDEIGELPASLQSKLLRFLQDKRFERIGENVTRFADVRVLAATNRNLATEVKTGRFREDLYYRLNTVELTLPALRERPEDILPLANHFLSFLAKVMRRRTPNLTGATAQKLLAYDWPGNLRELRNTLERALIFAAGDLIGPELLPDRLQTRLTADVSLGGDFSLDQVEREHLERVIHRTANLEEAAKLLGIDSSTLYRKRKRYQ